MLTQAMLDIETYGKGEGGLKLTDGTQFQGAVLTSDANGNATWQPAYAPPLTSVFDTALTSGAGLFAYVPQTSNGIYEVSGIVNITSISTDVLEMRLQFWDETGTQQTITFYKQGSTTPGMSTVGNNCFSPISFRAQKGGTININTVLTTSSGSISYNANAYIRFIQTGY